MYCLFENWSAVMCSHFCQLTCVIFLKTGQLSFAVLNKIGQSLLP